MKPSTQKSKDTAGFVGSLVIKTYKDGVLVRETAPMKNKIVAGSGGYGRNLVIRQLAGDTTYGIEIDSAAIGDDNTTPADSDTALGNSLVSGISVSNVSVSNDEVVFDFFASNATLPDDEYKEFGMFIGGRLFSRVLISPTYTKATGEDTIFSYTVTLSG